MLSNEFRRARQEAMYATIRFREKLTGNFPITEKIIAAKNLREKLDEFIKKAEGES